MILLDTNAFIWAMEDAPKLGVKSRQRIKEANIENPLGVSAILTYAQSGNVQTINALL
ncbi:MAG: hypothetical protein OXF72_06800 [Gammaproteobacteria bacterium]|nr:hypothetical protein [Gammaproteobacteria bacterium]MCY4200882.1 hypothetical protein [Gammaproteobacteria bacterium]MCY4276970.1 hypothetical protein [Gammaproteobacteria bacterium]MCY4324107.1 hypothetical protein [Gammaproteobacteria bacterium]